MLRIPKVFHADRRAAGAALDSAVTKHATRMLRRVANDLRLRSSEHQIITEPARKGRGCRVTLSTTSVLLQMSGSVSHRSVALTFRTRRGRTDLSGGGDNMVPLEQIATHHGYQTLLGELRLAAGLDGRHR